MGIPRKNRTKTFSFTLLELLIVITVIMILIGMLLPTLSRAKAKGKQAKCINRLKQMGIVFNYYVADEEGFMINDPLGASQAPQDPAVLADTTLFWHQYLRNELGDIGESTSTSHYFEDPGVSGAFALGEDNPESSQYMYNSYLAGFRLTQADETSQTMLVFGGSEETRCSTESVLGTGELLYPHPADRANILYLDGHANVVIDTNIPRDGSQYFWRPTTSLGY